MRVQYPEKVKKAFHRADPYYDYKLKKLKDDTPKEIRDDYEWAMKEMNRIDREWEEIFYGEAVTEYHE